MDYKLIDTHLSNLSMQGEKKEKFLKIWASVKEAMKEV